MGRDCAEFSVHTALNHHRMIRRRCERGDPERRPLRQSAAAPRGIPAHPIGHMHPGTGRTTGDPERQGRVSLEERTDRYEALLSPINGGEVMG